MPEPVEPIAMLSVQTPPADCPPEQDMSLLVCGALDPASMSTIVRSPTRAHPGLQLPSFESLGIAVPRLGSVGAIRGLDDDDDPCHQSESSSRGFAKMGARGHPTASAGRNCNAAIFDADELENVLQASSVVLDGAADLAAHRSASPLRTRSMDPLSRRRLSGMDSVNAKSSINRPGPGTNPNRMLDQGADRKAIQYSVMQQHGLADDVGNQVEPRTQMTAGDPELSCTPACALPLHSLPSSREHDPLPNACHISDLPLTPPQESTDHNWDSTQFLPQAAGSRPKINPLGDLPLRFTGADQSDSPRGNDIDVGAIDSMESARDSNQSMDISGMAATSKEPNQWGFVDDMTEILSKSIDDLRNREILTKSRPRGKASYSRGAVQCIMPNPAQSPLRKSPLSSIYQNPQWLTRKYSARLWRRHSGVVSHPQRRPLWGRPRLASRHSSVD
nr:hypothetical protein CFP56_70398 [Quercus suber]